MPEDKNVRQDLLTENYWDNSWEFKEEVDEATGQKRMVVEGILQEADTINRNNRIYPKPVMDVAVREINKNVEGGKVFGELDHPGWLDNASLKNTSHIFRKIWWDEKNENLLRGEMVITNTPSGEIFKEIVRAGGRPGISSRGQGDSMMKKLKSGGEVEVIKPGFRFSSFDFVIDPSVKSAQITRVIENILSEVKDKGEKAWYEQYYADEPSEEEDVNKKDLEKTEKPVEAPIVPDTVVPEVEPEPVEAPVEPETEPEKVEPEVDYEAVIAEYKVKIETFEKAIASVVEGITSVVTVLEGLNLIPEPVEKPPEEKSKTEVDTLTEKNTALETELNELKENLNKEKVINHINEVLVGKPFANLVKDRLAKCTTVEAVDAMLAEDEKLLKAASIMPEYKPKGDPNLSGKEEDGDEIKKKAKRLAGL